MIWIAIISGCVKMTTGGCTNGATTLSRINFSGHVGHETIVSWMLTITCYLVVGLGLGLVLVSGWLVVMHTYLYHFRLSMSQCLVI